jgi:hypothetical protein
VVIKSKLFSSRGSSSATFTLDFSLVLPECSELRAKLASGNSLDEFKKMLAVFKQMFLPYHLGQETFSSKDDSYKLLPFHPWLCQPYVRPPPRPATANTPGEASLTNGAGEERHVAGVKRGSEEDVEAEAVEVGEVKPKKTKRKGNKRDKERHVFIICEDSKCPNPKVNEQLVLGTYRGSSGVIQESKLSRLQRFYGQKKKNHILWMRR